MPAVAPEPVGDAADGIPLHIDELDVLGELVPQYVVELGGRPAGKIQQGEGFLQFADLISVFLELDGFDYAWINSRIGKGEFDVPGIPRIILVGMRLKLGSHGQAVVLAG